MTDNVLRRQALSLPSLLRAQYEDLEQKTRSVLSTPEIFSVQRIVLTGCGDSYAAGLATKYAFEVLAGVPTTVVSAIELSRHYDSSQLGFAPGNPLVIAVSNSGAGARVAEAVARAKARGAFALGITGNGASPLAGASSRVLPLAIPSFESAPGTRSYLVSLLVLMLLAVRIGEVRGRYTMDQATAYRRELLETADRLEALLPEMDAGAAELAAAWKGLEAFDFIGSGPDYAAAWFGHAKVMEATGQYAMHINTEEFLHLNFFLRRAEHIGTVLVASAASAAHSRAQEVLNYLKILGRPSVLLCDMPKAYDTAFPVLRSPATESWFFQPLAQFVPLCLWQGEMMLLRGEAPGRGCEGRWSFSKGGAAVANSETVILP